MYILNKFAKQCALSSGVPLYEVGGRHGGGDAAREHAEGAPRAEVRLHTGFQRRQLLRIHLHCAAVRLVRAELQTLHTIVITSTSCRTSSRVLVVVFLLSLSQSSTVKLCVAVFTLCSDFPIIIWSLDSLVVFGQWTGLV